MPSSGWLVALSVLALSGCGRPENATVAGEARPLGPPTADAAARLVRTRPEPREFDLQGWARMERLEEGLLLKTPERVRLHDLLPRAPGERREAPPRPTPPPAPATEPPPPARAAPAPLRKLEPHEVRVYYGTNRKAATFSLAPHLRRFWWPFVTAVLAWVAHRLVRAQLGPGFLWRATVVVGGMAALGWTAWAGLQSVRVERLKTRVSLLYGPDLRDDGVPWEGGESVVSFPSGHSLGVLERPGLQDLFVWEDVDRHVMLQHVTPWKRSEFLERLHAEVPASPAQCALVFVHGFNNTFEDAVLRTAQIARDVRFGGVPVCFSWASRGEVEDYTRDEDAGRISAAHLRDFLREVVSAASPYPVHVVAHSMGTRVLYDALRDVGGSTPRFAAAGVPEPALGRIVLAAPDTNAREFRENAGFVFAKHAEAVTLYVSDNDYALKVSRSVHGSPRAGEAAWPPVVVPPIQTVDVSQVCRGHTYIGQDGHVLGDVGVLLCGCQSPGTERVERTAGGVTWWELRPR